MARRVLACLAAVAGIGAAGAAHAQTVPVTIVNQTGITGKMYVTVFGQDPGTGKNYYYTDAAGNTKVFNANNPTPTDYGFNTASTSTFTFNVPQLRSARIYVSFCQPALMTVAVNGDSVYAPNVPAPWSPGSKNHTTIIDFAEYTWLSDNNMGINTTQVDSLGIPMKMTLQSASTSLNSGFSDKASALKVVAGLTTPPWSNLIIFDAKKRPTQVVSPHLAMDPGLGYNFPASYWDGYVTQVFNTYSKKTFTLTNQYNNQNIPYTGSVVNNQIVLKPTSGGASTTFNRPTSIQIWGDGPPYASGDAGPAASLQRYMQAAFLRSTFVNSSNSISNCSIAPYKTAPQNLYSKMIHALSINQGAYTFPYDDVCSQSSYVALQAPTKLTLTLFPLGVNWANMNCSN